MNIQLHRVHPHDEELLRTFLYYAIYVPKGAEPPPLTIVNDPQLSQYIDAFGQQVGDFGYFALVDNRAVGAVWLRLIRGYGYVDDTIPELSLAVLPGYQGKGIGTQLLQQVLTTSPYPKISLSVSEDNPAKRLYERCGFTTVVSQDGTATMLVVLNQDSTL